jgi:hypothetical protein
MKQIKVEKTGTITAGNPITYNDDAMTDGIINVYFNEPITIEAGSRIALDKFYCYIGSDTYKNDLANFPDLAIEMSSLSFESFDSEKHGRRNVVAYFPVQNSFVAGANAVSNRFLYESKVLSYLSINNETDIDLGTIVFRIVNLKSKKGLEAHYVSFNLLIN